MLLTESPLFRLVRDNNPEFIMVTMHVDIVR